MTAEQNTFRGSTEYVASQELMAAVNIAMQLQKPLLIKGEPGTGKTMLAEAIAKALDKPLLIWNIKSTTKAEAGVDDIAHYIRLGKLGEAFSSEEQAVLLIDEIDKADLEFPNDLLWELDRMEFYIHETKETVRAKHRPIVIITSNAEKELPDAFLRRCIFHYIEFPGPEQMEEIVRAHFDHLEDHLLQQAFETFYWIRGLKDIRKKPSTSELIDWLQALLLSGIDPEKIREELPFIGVLLKKDEDLNTLQKRRY